MAAASGITELIFFDQAIRHICNIIRILSFPFGHALLIGLGGSGRNSLSRLSAFLSGMVYQQINTAAVWREQFMKCMNVCGLEGKRTVFVVNDAKIFNEQILQDVSQYLNSGDVPDLYTLTDKLKIGDILINNGNNNKNL